MAPWPSPGFWSYALECTAPTRCNVISIWQLLVAAYAPTSDAPVADWNEYYGHVEDALAHARAGDVIIIGTDANASIGCGDGDASGHAREYAGAGAVGPCGLQQLNASGRRLRCFLETNELASLTTFFEKKYYGTWMHPRSKRMYQLDHFLVSQRDAAIARGSSTQAHAQVGFYTATITHSRARCELRASRRRKRTLYVAS